MAKRKNVLLILADQQRLDTVSAYGMNDICKTPHIDALAAEGMKFTNAYTPSAICAPARASVMTGLYPHKHGVVDNFTNIGEGIPLLFRAGTPRPYWEDQSSATVLQDKHREQPFPRPYTCRRNGCRL